MTTVKQFNDHIKSCDACWRKYQEITKHIKETGDEGNRRIVLDEKVNQDTIVDDESPIFETLMENEVYIISKSEDGILVVTNHSGLVGITRIPIPKEGKQ